MSNLELSLSCESYDLTRAILERKITPKGIDLNIIQLDSGERHTQMIRDLKFDICELSVAQYLCSKTRGLAVTAIPVFLDRKYRFGYILLNNKAGINKVSDLVKKRVGINRYIHTGTMWIRGMLEDDYGILSNQITWITNNQEGITDWSPPEGLKIERRPVNRTLDELLLAGEIDGIIDKPPISPVINNPKVRRLFPDYKQLEIAYYKRTKIFPIMHTIVIKNTVLNEYPWVAASLFDFFQEAKEQAYADSQDESRNLLVWYGHAMEEQREIFDTDPWLYGIKANRVTLDKMVEYAFKQGLTEYRPEIWELFIDC